MAPVAGCPTIKCGNSGCIGTCLLSVVEYGYKAGTKPATCRNCGKIFPRPNVTLSDFSHVKSDKEKGNNSRNVSPATSQRSRNTSPAMSRRSSVVSWSDTPHNQTVPKRVDAVMVDCGETEMCRKSVETHTERLAKGKESQSSLQNEFCGQFRSQVETVLPALSSDSILSAGATSEHTDISGFSAGSFALVQGIPRTDCASTHGIGGVEPVPRATLSLRPASRWFSLLVSMHMLVTTELNWCLMQHTSTERNVTWRRSSAKPKRSSKLNVMRNVNSWLNLRLVTKPLSLFSRIRQLVQT